MELQFRQTRTLVRKNLLLVFAPTSITFTIFRAFVAPIIVGIYLAWIFRVYFPGGTYGIGNASSVRSLVDGMKLATGNRNTLVLINNSTSNGGDIDRVIQAIAGPPRRAGKHVVVTTSEDDLHINCRATLQGTTKCYAAAVFQSSPSEGPGGIWNYTLRGDATFGITVDVTHDTNNGETYIIPLQHAIDSAIAGLKRSNQTLLPSLVKEYPFTSKTPDEFRQSLTLQLVNATINFAACVWYLALIGVAYQLVEIMAKERESEMSDLLESMMPNVRRWECQAIRLIAHHISFTITYGPSWVIVGLIAKGGLFTHANGAIIVFFFILGGLALTSFAILGAAFFKRAQVSGITILLLSLILAVVTQVTSKRMSTLTAAVLSILFTPSTFVNFFLLCAHFEYEGIPVSMTERAPNNPWDVPGVAFFIILAAQIVLYPLLAAFIERRFYGTASKRIGRNVIWSSDSTPSPIVVSNMTKIYRRHWFPRTFLRLLGREPAPVVAVKNLSISALKGQIMVLVGANGCGKSTTLNAIAGLSSMTSGEITVDGTGGIGLCPQKNVLWNSLTVLQHAKIFNQLKTVSSADIGKDIDALTKTCGLEEKAKSPSRNLSGGQKRKLQLILMLTGGSKVCCVDEVSGGLDPLSRRRIWDILLAERGIRTMILTTHFLDEGEFLADHVVIMSKGELKEQGSVTELKNRIGDGYRILRLTPTNRHSAAESNTGSTSEIFDETDTVASSAEALEIIKKLDKEGIKNYQVAGPTFEEVFMKLAADSDAAYDDEPGISEKGADSKVASSDSKENAIMSTAIPKSQSIRRAHVGAVQQASILFLKRWTVFKRNPAPILAALFIPIMTAGLVTLLLKDVQISGCELSQQNNVSIPQTLSSDLNPLLLVGPESAISPSSLGLFTKVLPNTPLGSSNTSILQSIHLVDTFNEFTDFINQNHANVTPGGVYLGDSANPPTFNYRSDIGILGIFSAVFMQNIMDVLLINQTISTQYTVFDFPFPKNTSNVLQFMFYFSLVMSFYPAFFALYPSREQSRNVRAMEYSNGVRPFPLWASYLLFDWMVSLTVAASVIIIFAATVNEAWYELGYLFVVIFLYGIASVLLSYTISLYSKSQLSAFALAAGGQAVMVVFYLTGYLTIEVRADPAKVDTNLKILHFTLGLITPIGQLIRATIVGLNLFSVLCAGSPPKRQTYPGAITLYGGPILYLIGQSFVLFGFLIWHDHRFSLGRFKRKPKDVNQDVESTSTRETEVVEEEQRVTNSSDGLKALHISKTYSTRNVGKVHAVDDLSFGVKPGEVFALVGPNGAGKSTTISMLRGDTQPSGSRGDLFIQEFSIIRARQLAREHLGVCPQHDAIDLMTVREHLAFYSGIRGVQNVENTVDHMIRNVGLQPFADRLADKLSGGNKRKLSLAIALIGSPEVVLLDEPSSGMDPLAKRNMWKTLAKFRPGRSILLTTHSMEEADALAGRVGIISKRLLDVGSTQHLRDKYGHGFHLHIIMDSAPSTTEDEIRSLQSWIETRLPGTELEGIPYHGQLRFIVPSTPTDSGSSEEDLNKEIEEISKPRSVALIFCLMEENKQSLGVKFYSVSPSTFDEVFLKVVERHQIQEEEIPAPAKPRWRRIFKSRSP